MQYLNLGCGQRFCPDWVNLDFISTSPQVIVHDLRQGIPYPDSYFDVVYLSHLLEHFSKHDGLDFIKDCYRVLKPGGMIRVVVPDLEQIVLNYLQAMAKALQGEIKWKDNYDWMMLELYDQTVREYSGGAMVEYLKQKPIPNEDFVFNRIGVEAHRIRQYLKSKKSQGLNQSMTRNTLFQRVINLAKNPRQRILRRLLGESGYQALRIGLFRQKGEIHKWMYDRYSLSRLLEQTGFEKTKQQTASDSFMADWTEFNLDTEPDGTVYKPDSLYMEANRPLG